MPERVKSVIRWILRMISPRLDYGVMSWYHAIKARLFLLRYPKIVTTGPRIVLVAGEDGPDKLHVYAPVYTVYKTLRPHFDVELEIHAFFKDRHVRRIAYRKPDLVLLSADIGSWHELFEQYQVPLMGASAQLTKLFYDKVAAKEVIGQLGVTTSPWVVLQQGEPFDAIVEHLRFPVVVKPRHSGSSEGVSKVNSSEALETAIESALRWDTEVIAEEYATGKEYTCTVYGNEKPRTLPLNRKIMPFEQAELEAAGEKLQASRFPVLSDEAFVAEIHARSKQIYTAFQHQDMIRIDWKYDHDKKHLCFLELSTLPWIGSTGGNIEECALAAGSSYDEFILHLFKESLRRHGRL